jgi:hypothetical protein
MRVPVFVGAYEINVPLYVENETLKINSTWGDIGSYSYWNGAWDSW